MTKVNLIKGLNEEQKMVVRHLEGPLFVPAGAGSGKTRCFVTRIANLVLEHNVDPCRILGMTFTKAATREMKERLENYLPDHEAKEVRLSTIHAWCFQVIREEFQQFQPQLRGEYLLIKPWEINEIITNFMQAEGLIKKGKSQIDPKELLMPISLAKNSLVKPKESVGFFRERGYNDPELLQRAYATYEMAKSSLVHKEYVKGQTITKPTPGGKIDFDDMMMLVYDKMSTEPHTLTKWARKYDFIQVDEAQDTCIGQIKIVDLLLKASGHNNIVMVGDLRQNCYSFRGADPKYLQDFVRSIGAIVYPLDTNYRSVREVVALGNRIAAKMADIEGEYRGDMKVGRI